MFDDVLDPESRFLAEEHDRLLLEAFARVLDPEQADLTDTERTVLRHLRTRLGAGSVGYQTLATLIEGDRREASELVHNLLRRLSLQWAVADWFDGNFAPFVREAARRRTEA